MGRPINSPPQLSFAVGERNTNLVTDVNNRADLSALKLAELQALATSLGIGGASKLRKGELVNAINENQGGDDISVENADTPTRFDTPQDA